MKIMIFVVLGLLAYEDIRYKTVPVWQLGILGALCVICMVHSNILLQQIPVDSMLGIIFGSSVLILCALTGWIGIGDGIVFLMLGIGFGGISMVNIFVLSMLMMGAGTVFMLILRIVNIKSEIPLMPYILLAALEVLL